MYGDWLARNCCSPKFGISKSSNVREKKCKSGRSLQRGGGGSALLLNFYFFPQKLVGGTVRVWKGRQVDNGFERASRGKGREREGFSQDRFFFLSWSVDPFMAQSGCPAVIFLHGGGGVCCVT